MTEASRNGPAVGGDQADRQAWVLRSRALLDRSAETLDSATLSRLNRARQGALDHLPPAPSRGRGLLRGWGVAAVTVGLALVLWRGLLPAPVSLPPPIEPLAQEVVPSKATPTPVAAPDFELLSDAERYALLEDLEFYAWLETTAAPEDQDG